MDSFWSKPTYWISIVVVSLVMALLSAYAQSQLEDKEIKTKGLVRDGILGAIFTTIVWVMSPDTIKNMVEPLEKMVGGAVTTASETVGASVSNMPNVPDVDIQVGPVQF
jgi:hypothetical protein